METPEGDGGAVATPEVPAAAEPTTTEPAAAGENDGSGAGAPETFDREYVEKLRDEAAKYRTRSKELESKFEGWDPEDRDLFLDISKDLLSKDPKAAAAAAAKLKGVSEKIAAEVGAIEDELERPLTKAEMEQFIAEKEAEREKQTALNQVLSESKALGYEPGSREFAELTWRAINDKEAGGTIAGAHERILAEIAAFEQQVIDKYVAGKKGQAESFPKTPTDGAAPGTTNEPPKTFEEARARARARAAAQVGK